MKELSCDNCGGRFSSSRTLSRHRKHSENCAPFQSAYFTCMRCGKGYENMKQFRLHSRHCRGTKTAYRLPDETRWQTRCAVLEGMIEATLGVTVPSIEYNDNYVSIGSLRRLKDTVKNRLFGFDTDTSPIPVTTRDETFENPPLPALGSPTVKRPSQPPDLEPEPEPEPESESDEDMVEESPEKPVNSPTESSVVSSPTAPEPIEIPPDPTPTWVEYTAHIEPAELLTRYSITSEPRPATDEEYISYRKSYLPAAVKIIRQNPTDSTVKFVMVKIREKLLGALGNYPSPVVFDVYRVYTEILKVLTAEGWLKQKSKEFMAEYMLPYPLIRFSDLHIEYPDVIPTNFDRELCEKLLLHYYVGKLGPGFAENGGGMVFQIFHFRHAMDTFIFSPQPWWNRDCLFAPQRNERVHQNPTTFITKINDKWEYDYFLWRYGEKMYGEITEAIRTRFRDIYQLIYGTNEYIDDWDSTAGVYSEDLYNLLKSYFSFYIEFPMNDFTNQLRFRVAEETLAENKKVTDLTELSVGRPPENKKFIKKRLETFHNPPVYDRVFFGFQALFDAPTTQKFWDSATGIRGDGGWYYTPAAYEKFLQPRFHRLYRCLCPESFFSETADFPETHSAASNDASITVSYPGVPQLKRCVE